MPTYEYVCTACGHRLDAVQKFTDDALTECPECAGALRKVFGPVGIVLKGSGFYKTDTRGQDKRSGSDSAGSNGSGPAKPETGTSTTAGSGSGTESAKSDAGGESKPAKESSPAGSSSD